MGLYLCVFDGDTELDGIDIGSYADYNCFRSAVTSILEHGNSGRICPTLILHSDCDGEWTPQECVALENELRRVAAAFRIAPPLEFLAEWQVDVARSLNLRPQTLYESFIDVDGEPLLDRLLLLCQLAQERGQPILFQ